MDISAIIDYFNPFKSWTGWITSLIGGLVAFGILSKDTADGIGGKIKSGINSVIGFFRDLIMGKMDPEAQIAEEGMNIQVTNNNRIFPTMEKALGIPGIGDALRDQVRDAIKEGGDPVGNAKKLYQTINEFVASELESKTSWTDKSKLLKQANAVAAAITGLPADETERANQNPATWNAGYIGMLKQAAQAKDKAGTMAASDVTDIVISSAMQAAAVTARTGV